MWLTCDFVFVPTGEPGFRVVVQTVVQTVVRHRGCELHLGDEATTNRFGKRKLLTSGPAHHFSASVSDALSASPPINHSG
jgi:hypothetical protein